MHRTGNGLKSNTQIKSISQYMYEINYITYGLPREEFSVLSESILK